MKPQRFIKSAGIVISFYNLKICILCTFFHSFFQKSGADLTGIAMFAVFFFDMDGIDADIISVQNTKSGCDDLVVHADGSTDGFLEDCLIHRWNNLPVDGIGGVF